MTNLLRSALGPRVVRPVAITAASTALLCAAFALGGKHRQPSIGVTPRLEPACVVLDPDEPVNSICSRDDRLPAISADGRLIATRNERASTAYDFAGVSIHLVDTRTSRLVQEILIVSLDELDQLMEPADGVSPAEQAKARRQLADKVDRRVAAVQRMLDAGRFRALALLGSLDHPEEPSQPGPGRIHGDIVGTTARVIDTASSAVLAQADFAVPNPHPPADDSEVCGFWELSALNLWWDPATGTLLGVPSYSSGGCICGGPELIEVVKRMR